MTIITTEPPVAVIFDKDGVLNHLEEMRQIAYVEAAAEKGWNLSQEQFHCVLGKTRAESMTALRECIGADFPAEEVRALRDESLSRVLDVDGTPMKEGADILLTFLKNQGIWTGVATSDHRENAIRELNRNLLSPSLDVIVTGEDVSRSKPAPDIYLKALEELSIKANRAILARDCFVVEDSEAGFEAGYAAGMQVIHIQDILPPSESIRSKAILLAKTLKDITDFIVRLVKGRHVSGDSINL